MASEQPKLRAAKQVVDDHAPWKPTPSTIAEHMAVKALHAGTANADQQKMALAWILEKACILKDQHFYPGGEEGRRNTDMALGRAYVGKQIARLLTTSPPRKESN